MLSSQNIYIKDWFKGKWEWNRLCPHNRFRDVCVRATWQPFADYRKEEDGRLSRWLESENYVSERNLYILIYRSSSVTLYPCEWFKNVWGKMMHKLVIDAIIYIFQKRWRNGRNSFCEISRPVKVKGKVFHVLTFCKRNDTFIECNWIGKNCFGGSGDSFCNKCIL